MFHRTGKHLMTPERRQELHEKADRILESEYRDLFIALVEVFYEHAMTERHAASPRASRSGTRKTGRH